MEVGILVFNGADELDVVGPYRVFGAVKDVETSLAPEISLHLVAEALGSVQLSSGLVILPTDVYVTCPELDVLLVPGGTSIDPEFGRRAQQANHQTIEFVRSRAEEAKVTASVCTGAFILAEAGLLRGRKANTHWRYRDELKELMQAREEGIEIISDRVVWDGDLVTGGGVTSGIDVALAIVEKACGIEVRSGIEAALELETPASS